MITTTFTELREVHKTSIGHKGISIGSGVHHKDKLHNNGENSGLVLFFLGVDVRCGGASEEEKISILISMASY